MTKYSIYRFYSDGRPSKLIKKNLSHKEATDHCNHPDTMKAGVWFDGFVAMKS